MKNQTANKALLEQNFGKIVKYKGTMFQLGELSPLGGFYIIAIESTKHTHKGAGQYVSRPTLLRLLKNQ